MLRAKQRNKTTFCTSLSSNFPQLHWWLPMTTNYYNACSPWDPALIGQRSKSQKHTFHYTRKIKDNPCSQPQITARILKRPAPCTTRASREHRGSREGEYISKLGSGHRWKTYILYLTPHSPFIIDHPCLYGNWQVLTDNVIVTSPLFRSLVRFP